MGQGGQDASFNMCNDGGYLGNMATSRPTPGWARADRTPASTCATTGATWATWPPAGQHLDGPGRTGRQLQHVQRRGLPGQHGHQQANTWMGQGGQDASFNMCNDGGYLGNMATSRPTPGWARADRTPASTCATTGATWATWPPAGQHLDGPGRTGRQLQHVQRRGLPG